MQWVFKKIFSFSKKLFDNRVFYAMIRIERGCGVCPERGRHGASPNGRPGSACAAQVLFDSFSFKKKNVD
jgi:hypothetical protein